MTNDESYMWARVGLVMWLARLQSMLFYLHGGPEGMPEHQSTMRFLWAADGLTKYDAAMVAYLESIGL